MTLIVWEETQNLFFWSIREGFRQRTEVFSATKMKRCWSSANVCERGWHKCAKTGTQENHKTESKKSGSRSTEFYWRTLQYSMWNVAVTKVEGMSYSLCQFQFLVVVFNSTTLSNPRPNNRQIAVKCAIFSFFISNDLLQLTLSIGRIHNTSRLKFV